MLSIDEAIAQEREIAKEQKTKYDNCPTRMRYCCEMCFHEPKCNEVAEYHEQLEEWLKELKKRRSEDYGYMADIHQSIGYRKAIDDFVEAILQRLTYAIYQNDVQSITNLINDVAEKLKGE